MAVRTSAPAAQARETRQRIGATIVEARSVRKTYETGAVRVDALRGIDLALGQGEMVAIMGPSGCGKTTLLNCLSGLDSLDAGEVLIEGTPLSEMSDRERTDYRARRMGFVFQFYNLMPVLTAAENVERRSSSRERAATRRDVVPSTRWGSSASSTERTTSPMRCRAASVSGSRSRARSSTTRPSSGPTSRPATSTRRTPARS